MNANHPYGQMLATSHYADMPHVSAWLTHAVGNPGAAAGSVAQPQASLPRAGYKTSPPLTATTIKQTGFAFRGSGTQV